MAACSFFAFGRYLVEWPQPHTQMSPLLFLPYIRCCLATPFVVHSPGFPLFYYAMMQLGVWGLLQLLTVDVHTHVSDRHIVRVLDQWKSSFFALVVRCCHYLVHSLVRCDISPSSVCCCFHPRTTGDHHHNVPLCSSCYWFSEFGEVNFVLVVFILFTT